jgi:hypothetical protein
MKRIGWKLARLAMNRLILAMIQDSMKFKMA